LTSLFRPWKLKVAVHRHLDEESIDYKHIKNEEELMRKLEKFEQVELAGVIKDLVKVLCAV